MKKVVRVNGFKDAILEINNVFLHVITSLDDEVVFELNVIYSDITTLEYFCFNSAIEAYIQSKIRNTNAKNFTYKVKAEYIERTT